MKKSFRTLSISVILVLVLLLVSVSITVAAPPLALHIEVEEIIDPNLDPDPFIASGPAFDSGVICETGLVSDDVINFYGPPNSNYRFIYILKRFDCDDGSGTFFIKLRVKLNLTTGDTTGRWQFTDGSGDYSRLRGHGTLIGIPQVSGSSFDILDIYDGKVH